MAGFIPYKGLTVSDTTPSGLAGQAIDANFRHVADVLSNGGNSGYSGYSGFSGRSGYSGFSGTSGYDGCAYNYTLVISGTGFQIDGTWVLTRTGPGNWHYDTGGGRIFDIEANAGNWIITAQDIFGEGGGGNQAEWISLISGISAFPCPPTGGSNWSLTFSSWTLTPVLNEVNNDYNGNIVGSVDSGNVSGTYNTNALSSSFFSLTATASVTIANPTNPTSRQFITWAITQGSGGSKAITLGNKFRGGTDVTIPLSPSTTAGKTDYLTAVYNPLADKWDVIRFVKGY